MKLTFKHHRSKLFEGVLGLSKFLGCDSNINNHQFGFKAGHSTSLCTNILKQTVDYYTRRGSYVFACFVDFQKAFYEVNYWKLFLKLLDDGIEKKIVRVLAFWYSNKICFVLWKDVVSTGFKFGNGTRQGGVLYFFKIH